AHFSSDILSSLLNEPIPGQGVFWSSVSDTIFPRPLRVLSFGLLYRPVDQQRSGAAVETYASRLHSLMEPCRGQTEPNSITTKQEAELSNEGDSADPLRRYQENAIKTLANNADFLRELPAGIPWGKIVGLLSDALPKTMHNRADVAYHLVKPA